MNVQPLSTDQAQAQAALREYREHRDRYDARDWEIERIYRAIAKGETVISVRDAIVRAGLDEQNRPKLAVCEAHALLCACNTWDSREVVFSIADERGRFQRQGRIRIPWRGRTGNFNNLVAQVPRIPPQYRPEANALSRYHILWEADWRQIPRDPYLLRRIGRDAWVVVAAWELTEVEVSVLRARQ